MFDRANNVPVITNMIILCVVYNILLYVNRQFIILCVVYNMIIILIILISIFISFMIKFTTVDFLVYLVLPF